MAARSNSAKKTSGRVTKKAAPKAAKQIHQEHVTERIIDQAISEAAPEPTDVATWKKGSQSHLVKLPSGFTARLRRMGLEGFLEQGLVPNRLLKVVQDQIDNNKPPSQRQMREMFGDMEAWTASIELASAATVACMVAPRVHSAPRWSEQHVNRGECGPEDIGQVIPVGHPSRPQETLFVDETDLSDRMFILQWVMGGTDSLATFREQSEAAVADLSAREDMGVPSE